jgi:hypothetical protein
VSIVVDSLAWVHDHSGVAMKRRKGAKMDPMGAAFGLVIPAMMVALIILGCVACYRPSPDRRSIRARARSL